jgi:NADH:ubiquinone oxidoreductase subunit C
MKDFLNYYSKNLILHIYKFSGLNKIVISDLDITKFLLKRSKYSSLIEYSLIDDNFDETNLRFKEIIEYRDYKNNLEIGFISKNSENERNSLSEIVVSAYSAERENFDLYGVTYRGDKDLRRILTSYGLQGNPLQKELSYKGNITVKSGKLSFKCQVRHFCTFYVHDYSNYSEITVTAISDIMLLDMECLKFVAYMFHRSNPYGYASSDPLLTKNELDILTIYWDSKDRIQMHNFCINHLKKSELYRRLVISNLNMYSLVSEEKLTLRENPFVVYSHLPSVQKFLEISKLKIETLDTFCKNTIDRRSWVPLDDLREYFSAQRISIKAELIKLYEYALTTNVTSEPDILKTCARLSRQSDNMLVFYYNYLNYFLKNELTEATRLLVYNLLVQESLAIKERIKIILSRVNPEKF